MIYRWYAITAVGGPVQLANARCRRSSGRRRHRLCPDVYVIFVFLFRREFFRIFPSCRAALPSPPGYYTTGLSNIRYTHVLRCYKRTPRDERVRPTPLPYVPGRFFNYYLFCAGKTANGSRRFVRDN